MTYDLKIINDIKTNLIKTDGETVNSAIIRRDWFKSSETYKTILKITHFLDIKNPSVSERIYCIMNGIEKSPTCKFCNIYEKRFVSSKQGYRSCINKKCQRMYKKWKSPSKNKIDNYAQLCLELSDKFKSNQYNLSEISKLKEYIEMKVDRKYKNISYVNPKIIKNDFDFLLSAVYYTQDILPLTSDKTSLNMSERYFLIVNDLKTPQKCLCGNNRKFLNFYSGYQKECGNVCRRGKRLIEIKDNVLDTQNMTILSDFNTLKNNTFQIQCNECNKIHERSLTNARWMDIYCPTCYGDANSSKEEKDVLAYIQTLYSGEILENSKIDNLEIDILLPDIGVGFEYDGLLWHSFGSNFPNNQDKEKNNKNRGLIKTKKCEESNIKLFHINSDEWYSPNNKDIWKSMIRNALGKSNRIYARKCSIVNDLPFEEVRKFLENNHLQGHDKSPIRSGLYFDGELVSIMTFSKPRFNKSYEYELVRFCNKKNCGVIGGASKLFSNFLKIYNPLSVISYADRRYSGGNLYKSLGFSFKENTRIGYFYIKNIGTKTYKKVSRVSAQKHKLPKFLEKFDENLTEVENMFMNEYRRVWNCGNSTFIYRRL